MFCKKVIGTLAALQLPRYPNVGDASLGWGAGVGGCDGWMCLCKRWAQRVGLMGREVNRRKGKREKEHERSQEEEE